MDNVRPPGHVTLEELYQLIGTQAAELHSARLRTAELERELGAAASRVEEDGRVLHMPVDANTGQSTKA